MRTLLLSLILFLTTATSALAAGIVVSAAASLTDAFTELKAAFEARHPGVDVLMNFASSGSLYRQIEQGAPVDVFASANPKWMNKAGEGGLLLQGTRRDFARNVLVLAVPAGNPASVTGPGSLEGDRVARIGIGTPETVPAGQYARQSLTTLGLYVDLGPKLIFGESVRQVLDYLRRSEVDAGFVYKTDAIRGGKAVVIIAEMPLDTPVTYPAAALAHAPNKDAARAFLDFLGTADGLDILVRHGFDKP